MLNKLSTRTTLSAASCARWWSIGTGAGGSSRYGGGRYHEKTNSKEKNSGQSATATPWLDPEQIDNTQKEDKKVPPRDGFFIDSRDMDDNDLTTSAEGPHVEAVGYSSSAWPFEDDVVVADGPDSKGLATTDASWG